MSRRTYEDVQQERRVAKIERDIEDLKPQTDNSGILFLPFALLGWLIRPFRKLLPDSINSVIDHIAVIISFGGILLAIVGGWRYDSETSILYGIALALVGTVIGASSPSHEKKK